MDLPPDGGVCSPRGESGRRARRRRSQTARPWLWRRQRSRVALAPSSGSA